MAEPTSFTLKAPVFSGQNYVIWSVKMKAYLRVFGLWDVVESNAEPDPLPRNPTLAQMRHHSEAVAKKFKALTCIHSALSDELFSRIMTCNTAKEAWDKLAEEFQGDQKARQMEVLNLRREFEMLRMKEAESVKEFADKIMKVVNQLRLLGETLEDKRVVEKVVVSLPEKFEAKISSLEDSKDLNTISLSELVNALHAVETRQSMRQEAAAAEGAFVAQLKNKTHMKEKMSSQEQQKEKKFAQGNTSRVQGRRDVFPPCPHCKKRNHTENFCWFRPGIQCRSCHEFGHHQNVCKSKREQVQQEQNQQAQVAENVEEREEMLFMVRKVEGHVTNSNLDEWLIDSGCTNHMTPHAAVFKNLDSNFSSQVRIGNGELVEVKGKGDAKIKTQSGTILMHNVLYVPEITHSLISVGQLLEYGYAISFHGQLCDVVDKYGAKMITTKMKNRNFPICLEDAYSAVVGNSVLVHDTLKEEIYDDKPETAEKFEDLRNKHEMLALGSKEEC